MFLPGAAGLPGVDGRPGLVGRMGMMGFEGRQGPAGMIGETDFLLDTLLATNPMNSSSRAFAALPVFLTPFLFVGPFRRCREAGWHRGRRA